MVDKKEKLPRRKGVTGRRPSPIEDLRSERLVIRMHPDLFESLTEMGKVYGVSRSQYVERILIQFLNLQAGQRPLDMTGRYARDEVAKRGMAASDTWATFGRRNLQLLGIHAERAAAAAGKPTDPEED